MLNQLKCIHLDKSVKPLNVNVGVFRLLPCQVKEFMEDVEKCDCQVETEKRIGDFIYFIVTKKGR